MNNITVNQNKAIEYHSVHLGCNSDNNSGYESLNDSNKYVTFTFTAYQKYFYDGT